MKKVSKKLRTIFLLIFSISMSVLTSSCTKKCIAPVGTPSGFAIQGMNILNAFQIKDTIWNWNYYSFKETGTAFIIPENSTPKFGVEITFDANGRGMILVRGKQINRPDSVQEVLFTWSWNNTTPQSFRMNFDQTQINVGQYSINLSQFSGDYSQFTDGIFQGRQMVEEYKSGKLGDKFYFVRNESLSPALLPVGFHR